MSRNHANEAVSDGQVSARRTSKNTVMLLAGTLLKMVASFAFVLYCADQMGVEGFGKYSIAIHYFELFLGLMATAAGIMLTRDLARWPRHGQSLITSALILVYLLWIAVPAGLWLVGWAFGYSSDTRWALLLASLALVPAAACSVFEAVFVAKERAEFVTLGTATESFARILLSASALWLGYGLLSLVMVIVIVRFLMLFAYSIGLARLGLLGWEFHRGRTKRFMLRWRVFAAENWMAAIYTNLDMVVLSWLSGEVSAGLYSAAWKIVRLGAVVAKSYTTAIFPVMSRLYAKSRSAFSDLHQHSIRGMCIIALPAIAVVSVIPDRIVNLLFNPEFANAANILRVLIWVMLIEFLNPFLSHLLFAQGQQHKSMHVAAISLSINLVATYFLVLRFDAVGAAIATVLGGLVATICYSWFALSRQEMLESMFAGLRVVAASVGLALATLLGRELPWIVLISTCVIVYACLLFVVGAVGIRDLRFVQSTFLTRAAS